MKVTQIYEILNDVIGETLGETAIVNEDLSNIVDIGTNLQNADIVDKYVKKLVNRIGKTIFVDRVYKESGPSIMMDGWEYGSIMQKIMAELPDSTENSSWDLNNGETYNQDIFYQPEVYQLFFNNMVTYEVDMSFAHKQVKQSFANPTQLNAFFSMIENRIRMRLTIDYDNLKMRTINSFTAATLSKDYGTASRGTKSGVRAVNLLYLYNNMFTDNKVTKANCLFKPEFIRFASRQIALTTERLRKASRMYNIGGQARFTPSDLQHLILLSEFAKSANVYLQSDTFHEEFTALPKSEEVPYWQGSGTDYGFDSTGRINVSVPNPANTQTKVQIEQGGILGVLFDHEALGVNCAENRVTSHTNNKAEFYSNFYKSDARYFNDWNEQFVVFFVEDAAAS